MDTADDLSLPSALIGSSWSTHTVHSTEPSPERSFHLLFDPMPPHNPLLQSHTIRRNLLNPSDDNMFDPHWLENIRQHRSL